jgi:hypothetical protein
MAAVAGRSTQSLAGDEWAAYNYSGSDIGSDMGAVEKLELLIKSLSAQELAQFREWFVEFDAQVWDRQIEADAAAGKLDRLIEESMADHRAQKTRPL